MKGGKGIGLGVASGVLLCCVLGVVTAWLTAWLLSVRHWTSDWLWSARWSEAVAIEEPYLVRLARYSTWGVEIEVWFVERFDYSREDRDTYSTRRDTAHRMEWTKNRARTEYEDRYGLTVFDRLECENVRYEGLLRLDGNSVYPTSLADRAARFRESVIGGILASPEAVRVDLESAGWPFSCLMRAQEISLGRRYTSQWTNHWSIKVEQDLIESTTTLPLQLPVRPIWSGLAANTLCYAAAWAVPIFSQRLVFGWVRRRQGRCPGCGYELHGAFETGCPECGRGRSNGGGGGEYVIASLPLPGTTSHPD